MCRSDSNSRDYHCCTHITRGLGDIRFSVASVFIGDIAQTDGKFSLEQQLES